VYFVAGIVRSGDWQGAIFRAPKSQPGVAEQISQELEGITTLAVAPGGALFFRADPVPNKRATVWRIADPSVCTQASLCQGDLLATLDIVSFRDHDNLEVDLLATSNDTAYVISNRTNLFRVEAMTPQSVVTRIRPIDTLLNPEQLTLVDDKPYALMTKSSERYRTTLEGAAGTSELLWTGTPNYPLEIAGCDQDYVTNRNYSPPLFELRSVMQKVIQRACNGGSCSYSRAMRAAVVDRDFVYLGRTGSVLRSGASASSDVELPLVSGASDDIRALAVDDNAVYYTDADSGLVGRISKQ
jgi:hypothetical protein